MIKHGFAAGTINGDMDQFERNNVLALFANKSLSVLVATDVAARGLDIKGVDLVANFELSKDPKVYVHRIGRTGRAGKNGNSISFFDRRDDYKVKIIEEFQKKKRNIRRTYNNRWHRDQHNQTENKNT